jgi:transposase-like protein
MWQEATAIKVSEAMKEVKAFEWEGDYQPAARAFLKELIEQRLVNGRDAYLAELASRGEAEADRRNGYYPRRLLTEVGEIELAVARTRNWSGRELLGRLKRRSPQVDRTILNCFVLGASTRKVGVALAPLLGKKVSAGTVSGIAGQLDEAVAAYHRRPLSPRYRVLILDGVVVKRKTGAGSRKRTILVALGITWEGKKEVIDFYQAKGESEAEWSVFLNDLYRRGLTEEKLELIVVDGGKGLLAALGLVYGRVPVQRCWAHKARNVTDKAKKADREPMLRDLNRISHASNRVKAQQAFGGFARRWQVKYPKAVACVAEDIEELLAFFALPAAWHKQVRTTNAIERRFREVRRRIRPMEVFSDRTSIERILYAVLMYENQKQKVTSPFLLTQEI